MRHLTGMKAMRNVITLLLQYIRAFILIYLCLYAGIAISSLLPLTIPGSIIGMLILFTLLSTQILPYRWVKPGCSVLIRYGFTVRAYWGRGDGLLRHIAQ